MYVILPLDTEDVCHPPEDYVDDVPGWLAATTSDVGITGTLLPMGQRARSMRAWTADPAWLRTPQGESQQGHRYGIRVARNTL